jgi:hypothetical protein
MATPRRALGARSYPLYPVFAQKLFYARAAVPLSQSGTTHYIIGCGWPAARCRR